MLQKPGKISRVDSLERDWGLRDDESHVLRSLVTVRLFRTRRSLQAGVR